MPPPASSTWTRRFQSRMRPHRPCHLRLTEMKWRISKRVSRITVTHRDQWGGRSDAPPAPPLLLHRAHPDSMCCDRGGGGWGLVVTTKISGLFPPAVMSPERLAAINDRVRSTICSSFCMHPGGAVTERVEGRISEADYEALMAIAWAWLRT